MSADPLQTLLLPFATGELDWPEGKVLFINGEQDEALPEGTVIQQYFKPKAAGAVAEIPEQGAFDAVLVLGSKNPVETLYFIGRALELPGKDGLLVCAAANDAGGKRLKGDLKSAGLSPLGLSKHKSQVVWAIGGAAKAPEWVSAGQVRSVLDGRFVSQPGIFGWDRVDAGSALLAGVLPDGIFRGAGADFGCGYGYLAADILARQPKVKRLYCLDADYRAVEAARANLADKGTAEKYFGWADLTQRQKDLPALDFVVMNPPFHEGKNAQYSIGIDCIKTAAASLKKGGWLWMVANAHLPYETALDTCFAAVEKVTEEQGFKVFHARK